MPNGLIQYGPLTPIGITLGSLAPSATVGRQSTGIGNLNVLGPPGGFLDVAVELALKLQAGTPAGAQAIRLYLAWSADNVNWSDNATGADAPITLRNPTNLLVPDPPSLLVPTAGGLLWVGGIPSVAKAFGGNMPAYWSLVVINDTNVAFTPTESDHTKQYRGSYLLLA